MTIGRCIPGCIYIYVYGYLNESAYIFVYIKFIYIIRYLYKLEIQEKHVNEHACFFKVLSL